MIEYFYQNGTLWYREEGTTQKYPMQCMNKSVFLVPQRTGGIAEKQPMCGVHCPAFELQRKDSGSVVAILNCCSRLMVLQGNINASAN